MESRGQPKMQQEPSEQVKKVNPLEQSGIIRRELIEEYMDSIALKEEAAKVLETAKQASLEAEQKAYQEGFNKGIADAAAEVSAQILRLQEDYNSKLVELEETAPQIVAEICLYLIKLKNKDVPGFDMFLEQLKVLVVNTIQDFVSQDDLILRVSDEFKDEVKAVILSKFGKKWLEENIQVRGDRAYTGFNFSLEHRHGVFHFNGKKQLFELLNKAFPAEENEQSENDNPDDYDEDDYDEDDYDEDDYDEDD